jgi:N-acetylmuramate 1-kinase
MTHPASNPNTSASVHWDDGARHSIFNKWLQDIAPAHHLLPESLRTASADASFRRYLRVDAAGGGSCIIMDAPPAKEDCRPFVKVAGLMAQAHVHAPQVLEWDEAHGFMLLTDMGHQTMLDAINPQDAQANLPRYMAALDALLAWQHCSQPGVLPPYNEALLRRELELFPEWYLGKHRGMKIEGKLRETLDKLFAQIIASNLDAPSVFVHRDFMPRNLMMAGMAPTLPAAHGALPPKGADSPWGGPAANRAPTIKAGTISVLDFQDAVYGPVTYDIASLMRDAFLSWDEDFVMDVTIRYWERARKMGLLNHANWSEDFGQFYCAVEWMGLQRHLKVLGIFARLTLRDGKPKYLADTPRFIAYVRATASRYVSLRPLLDILDQAEGTEPLVAYSMR